MYFLLYTNLQNNTDGPILLRNRKKVSISILFQKVCLVWILSTIINRWGIGIRMPWVEGTSIRHSRVQLCKATICKAVSGFRSLPSMIHFSSKICFLSKAELICCERRVSSNQMRPFIEKARFLSLPDSAFNS